MRRLVRFWLPFMGLCLLMAGFWGGLAYLAMAESGWRGMLGGAFFICLGVPLVAAFGVLGIRGELKRHHNDGPEETFGESH